MQTGAISQARARSTTTLDAASVMAELRGKPHDLIDVGHSRVAHWAFGEGPDVLCVHGWPLHGATWRHLVPQLSDRYRVHVIDLPGTGQSEWSEGSRIDLEAHGDSVRRVIDGLGLSRFALVAHDSGGAIARLAAAGDRRVAGLVLAGTEIPGHHPWQIDVFKLGARLPGRGKLLIASMGVGFIRRSPLVLGGCFTDVSYGEGEFGELFIEPLLGSSRVAEGQLKLVQGFDGAVIDRLAEAHRRIDAPVLCIWGTEDPFFPVAKARQMLAGFAGGAELLSIEGGKLFVHEDHAGAFGAATRAFLGRVL